jgi:hypothetical protein
MVDVCYPEGTDWSCAYDEDELAALREEYPDLIARSEALAWSTLQSLTGYRLSLCPVMIRPCVARCSIPTWFVAPVDWTGTSDGGSFSPFIMNGNWYNGCGCASAGECSCVSLAQIILPSEVGGIDTVWLDGVELPKTAYRVDNANRLVLTNGDVWPTCQDMTNDDPNDGGVWVSYWPGVAPTDLLKYAAGVLANEFRQACSGGACRLPANVSSITRQGLQMDIPTGLFPGGATGIHEVDAVIRIYNPFALKQPPRVMSVDRPRGRMTTWGA